MTQETVGKAASAEDQLHPYRLKERLLTVPELALYKALQAAVGSYYVIFAKVALNDIFYIVRPNENVHYFNKLFRKHVDFLLCEPKTMKPQIGVEQVRAAEAGGSRSADQFIEDLFAMAGIPLVQVPANSYYETGELVPLFQAAIKRTKQIERHVADASGDSVPMCPVCGKMMVLRTHRSGALAGQLYYGCIDNPSCPGAVALK